MKNKKQKILLLGSVAILFLVILTVILTEGLKGKKDTHNNTTTAEAQTQPQLDSYLLSNEIKQDILPLNPYSRPGDKIRKVNAIVIHYVGNPNTTAAQNRSYFNNLASQDDGKKKTYASSHYIVGLEGEIIQCVPLEEIAYASNDRNHDTIAIECCHPDDTGEFTRDTYDSLVKLTAALCRTYGLMPETDIIRHYDITGKECPRYFVQNKDAWYEFKLAVKNSI